MRIALFLGAGASVPLGKPTTKELKEKLTDHSPKSIQEEIFQSFLNHPEYQDIEYVLQSIKEIVSFTKSKGGRYFFEHGKNGIFEYRHAKIPFSAFTKNVEKISETLEDIIFEYYRWNISSNNALLNIYGKIFDYLRNSDGPIQIFSTNYDKAIEQFCHINDQNYICTDGFKIDPPYSPYAKWTGEFESIGFDYKKNVFLYKLHGSLNWKKHVEEGLVRTNEESKSNDGNFTKNIVIYPTLTPKEEEDAEPYKTIIEIFKEQMKKIDVCIVIGYSFRDSLNETFKEFVSRKGILIAISPNIITDYRKNVLKIEPSMEQIKEWKQTTIANSGGLPNLKGEIDTVHLIQKKLEIETIKEIITDLDHIIYPEKSFSQF